MQPPSARAGGPLQARGIPNQQQSRTTAGVHNIKVASTSSKQPSANVAPRHPTAGRQAPPPPRPAPAAPSQAAAPKPQSRLEREKKKEYKDPPNIGPWKLGKLIGQGASGELKPSVELDLVVAWTALLTLSSRFPLQVVFVSPSMLQRDKKQPSRLYPVSCLQTQG